MPPLASRDIGGILAKHNYTELRKIGEGSFGKVLLVQNGSDGAKLVCKIVDVSAASPKETQDALKEGRLLAAFKHPYIVRYSESFIDGGWLCLVMDYCEGGDLSKQIEAAKRKSHRISEDQILRWMTQALLALKYIHDKHVLHRDLKSGNFFLSGSGNLKMGDFGISCVLSCTIACARTQIGTPYYLSPEVCMEKPYAWPSDIWAMGCVLFELCALKVPFEAANISNLVQRICRGPTPAVPAPYSDFVRQLCTDMMNRNSVARPSAEEILQRPRMQAVVKMMLEEAQAGQAGHASSSHDGSDARPRNVHSAARSASNAQPCHGPPAVAGTYADAAGTYRKGDSIEYLSSTHKDWLLATVVDVDNEGRIVIDLKPNTWISRSMQAQQVRPRRKQHPDSFAAAPITPAVCATPMSHRSVYEQVPLSQPALRGRGLPGHTPSIQSGMPLVSHAATPLGSHPSTPMKRCGSRVPSPGFPGSACGIPAVQGLSPQAPVGRYDGFRQNDLHLMFGLPHAYGRQPPGPFGLPRGPMELKPQVGPRPCKVS